MQQIVYSLQHPLLRTMEDPNEYDIDKEVGIPPEIEKLEKIEYREVCWDLNERGTVGETILHLCLLNSTSIYADLAKRLLKFYPKLINDIYISDEYYGESVLHVAIVNEDPSMVKFLLDSGADFHERCFGNFMCSEDQKASRSDSLDHEWVNLQPETNYEGYVYWGEYPLSFAACLGQEECYRLILARGGNPNNKDTNGNTVLHMLVIYKKIASFDMAYEVGADLSIKNVQNLTPLTLAAKIARIEMFFHILKIEREIYWQIGSITCAAYPLTQIDTIDNKTGNISNTSALNLVVFGDKDEHLELMDGVLIDLLNAKWNTFVKFRFYRQFFQFSLYFLISLICFTLRPGPPPVDGIQSNTEIGEMTEITPNKYPDQVVDNSNNVKRRKRYVNTTEFATIVNIRMTTNENNISQQFYFNTNTTDAEDDYIYTNGNVNTTTNRDEQIYTAETFTMKPSSFFENFTSVSSYDVDITTSIASLLKIENSRFVLESEAAIVKIESKQRNIVPNKINLPIFTSTGSTNKCLPNAVNSLSSFNAPIFCKCSIANWTFESVTLIKWWHNNMGKCRLMTINDYDDIIRLSLECIQEIGAFLYLLAAVREAGFLGLNMFIENLMTAPSRVMFLCSCLLMMAVPFLRYFCLDQIEDIIVVVIMLTTSPYFLFFCRGFKTVGPFVVMIYRMIMGDLLRFVCIYLIFVLGFSQAYYIIFLTFDNPKTSEEVDDSVNNPMPNPIESVVAMFLMSMNAFSDYYVAFEKTNHETVAKFCFVIFMVIVAILLVNMLIAMMGNTYQKIAETRNESQRQWARIVLVVERGVHPTELLKQLMIYSQPMSDGRRALVLRLNQTDEDKEEMKEILELKRSHNRHKQKLETKNQNNLEDHQKNSAKFEL
ncbi:hypothetical protein PGB90_009539 [Kerria lacca]